MSGRLIDIAAAKFALGLCDTKDLVTAAVGALEQGYDTPSLVTLAGYTDEDEDAKEMFRLALTELGVAVPSKRSAIVRLSRAIAQEILSGNVAADVGSRKIWDLTLSEPNERIAELDTFVYAASEWNERPEDHVIFERGVMDAAGQLVKGYALDER